MRRVSAHTVRLLVALVGHHEIQRLAEAEDHHQQHHHQRNFVDGFHVIDPIHVDAASIAAASGAPGVSGFRRPAWWALLLTVAGALLFVRLGVWQLHRAD